MSIYWILDWTFVVFGNTFPIHDALVVCFELSFFTIIRISFLCNIICEHYKGNLEMKKCKERRKLFWANRGVKREWKKVFLIRFDAKKFNMTSLAPCDKGFEDYDRKLLLNEGFYSELWHCDWIIIKWRID